MLPPRLRPAVVAIYRWARHADDIADEGDALAQSRIDDLDAMRNDFARMEHGKSPVSPLALELAPHIAQHELPITAFRDLLSAFAQDVHVHEYPDFDALRDYCTRSANPVGRLMLQLYKSATPQHLAWSDSICTGLQLANFCQDVSIDHAKRRTYMPLDTLTRANSSLEHIAQLCAGAPVDDRWRTALGIEVSRARDWLRRGSPLARALPGRIGWELRFVVAGGLRILDLIERADYDVFRHRPIVGVKDTWAILRTAVNLPTVSAQ
jgi:squalene synthase HpnC